MSKLGKKSISIPSGVEIVLDGGQLTVTGPQGTMKREVSPLFSYVVADGKLSVQPKEFKTGREGKQGRADWGLYRALAKNMVQGVSEGFKEVLELNGVGYKAIAKPGQIELSLGFSHPILFPVPEGVAVKIEKNLVTISGIDKELVGSVAARIRALKVPDPYKVHGVKYADEVIKVKAGKKAATAAG